MRWSAARAAAGRRRLLSTGGKQHGRGLGGSARGPWAALLGVTGAACAVIYFVHWSQSRDRSSMKVAVKKDRERIRRVRKEGVVDPVQERGRQ